MHEFTALDGALLVDKPVGHTSHDVVAAIRRRFVLKKVGHCGTLDPDAAGLLVHIGKSDEVWPRCIQCQGQHEKQGDLFLMNGADRKEHKGQGSNVPLPKREPSNEKPVGEWNICQMVCAGNSVKAYINGRLMNEATECNVSSGRIGFQSEGGEFEIRKVFLAPLKTP